MTGPQPAPRPGLIRQGDRDKALRPLPLERRRAAFEEGLAAYDRGDFFAAHEALEPAWMGTDDLAERALHQGLIKVAAAYVHAVRGNPAGIAKNLAGARGHLAPADARRPGVGRRRRRRCSPPSTPASPTPASPRPARHPEDPARMNRPMGIPAVDPLYADLRRRDPCGPRCCSTSASATSSPPSASRARCSSRCPSSPSRLAEVPRDRPILVLCASGGRSASVTGELLAGGLGGRRQRRRRHHDLGADGPAGQARAGRARRGRGGGLGTRRRPASALAALGPAAPDRGDDLPHPLLVGERPAHEDQQDEVDGADGRGVEVADLLADLAVELEARHRRAEQAQLEERRLRGEVRPRGAAREAAGRLAAEQERVRARRRRAAAPWMPSPRSVWDSVCHSGMTPSASGIVHSVLLSGLVPSEPPWT